MFLLLSAMIVDVSPSGAGANSPVCLLTGEAIACPVCDRRKDGFIEP
jgi:hypothetical protein